VDEDEILFCIAVCVSITFFDFSNLLRFSKVFPTVVLEFLSVYRDHQEYQTFIGAFKETKNLVTGRSRLAFINTQTTMENCFKKYFFI
jgi:hypothetical protein